MIKRFATECYSKYLNWLVKRPYVANMVSTGILMSTGDILAQTLFSKDEDGFSLIRTARMGLLGVVFLAPTVLTFYRIMEKRMGPSNAMLKVLADQVVFAPSMLLVFMPTLDLLSGHSWQEAKLHIKADYFSILLANWMFWPAIQIINFNLMPLHVRLQFVQVVAVMWNTYLAWKLHSHHKKNVTSKS